MRRMRATDVKDYLKAQFPSIKFYAGTIDKNVPQCVGVYPKGRAPFKIALGGAENTSYWYLPISVLVHWGEDTGECETKADELYDHFFTAEDATIAGYRVVHFDLLDSCAVDLSRDERNICEAVIRLNVIYTTRKDG